MPKRFVSPIRAWEIFTPMKFDASSRNARGSHSLRIVARLRPGISLERAHNDMTAISKRLEAAYAVNKGHFANVVPLDDAMRGKTRPAMVVLLAAVGLVLMVVGNYLGKVRSNFFFGIRTPWTLSSELSWNRTHRLAGRLLVALGLVTVATPVFPWAGLVALAAGVPAVIL